MNNDLIRRREAARLLRAYADEVGCRRGEYELANGILKAVCFIEDCGNVPTAYDIDKDIQKLREIQYEDECCEVSLDKTRLKHFDKLDELGRLIELPCAIGDTVYVISDCRNIPAQLDGTLYDENGGLGTATGYYCPYSEECPFDSFECEQNEGKEAVFEVVVEMIQVSELGIYILLKNCTISGRIEVDVFLNQEDAQKFLEDKEDTGD